MNEQHVISVEKKLRFSRSEECREFIRTRTAQGSEYAAAYRAAHIAYNERQRIGVAVKE